MVNNSTSAGSKKFVLFLPGYSGEHNRPEMQTIAAELQHTGLNVYQTQWPHWEALEMKFDLAAEVEKAALKWEEETAEVKFLIGKSIGTIVAANLLKSHIDINPMRIVLMGIPMSSAKQEDKDAMHEVAERFGNKLVVVQNEHDPFGSSEEVTKLFGHTDVVIDIQKDVSTHAYVYPEVVVEAFNLGS